MNNVRENSATAKGEKNNPHSRCIFNAKWGRLKNAFNANAGWESASWSDDENRREQVVDTYDLDIINDVTSLTNRWTVTNSVFRALQ